MSEEAPTHNERILAGALMIALCTKAMDSPGTDTRIGSKGIVSSNRNLMDIAHVGYKMMGIPDPQSFMRTGECYDKVLAPAIEILYEKFAIIEQVMNS